MYIYIKERFEISNLIKKIEKVVRKCITCKEQARKMKSKIIFSEFEPVFGKLGLDLIGPLPKSLNGGKYIIIITDYAIKYTLVKEIKRKTEEEVANFILNEVIFKFGPPREIRTDNGKEFT
ncbi:POL4 [Hepatospora eriocheir]|uniref:POL4 n=1 Tax=Hepatospora eriocheir TaxID=1081669 RepID=A0A1X0QJP1_9MICR|nr:POL4 [Hepatospora eriocheir]